jgi:hypothetical protein
VQIIDIDLGHAVQAERRAEAAHARLVNSSVLVPEARLSLWSWAPRALRFLGSKSSSPSGLPGTRACAHVVSDSTLHWADV